MVVLKIFNVDDNYTGKPLCTFPVGEHVVGRGTLCNDRRISKKHVVMNVKDDEATLTLVHITPIFFKSTLSSSKIQMIEKDESIRLSDGDKFAFIVDTWYTIKIENENNSTNVAGSSTSTILIPKPSSLNTIVASTSSTQNSQPTSHKRSTEDLYSEERKKLKLLNESLDKLQDNFDQIVAQDYQENNSGGKESTKEVEKNNTTEVFKRVDISDSDDEDSDVEMLPEITQDTEVINGVQDNVVENSEPSNNEDKDEDKPTSEILDDIKKEPMIENDETPDLDIQPQEVKSEPRFNEENTSSEIGESNQFEKPPDFQKNDAKPTAETVGQNEEEAVPTPTTESTGSSGTNMASTLRREQCWYGQNCYRKNTSHKEQFSHPGDSDYSESSDDPRPVCPYGSSCYRTNMQHRKDYKHPTSRPAPKPSNKRKRRTKVDAQPNMDYDSESEDEGDPFSADESSSASEVFEGGDSDSDYMEEPSFDDMDDSEEVKIMFKEAKRFLKRKRRD